MTPAAGPYVVVTLLLAAAGALKATRPHDTAVALGALHLPNDRRLVRALGAVEAAVAIGALGTGRAELAVVVGVSYLAFTAFVLAAARAHTPLRSCGCLGGIDTPPHPVHVVVNLSAAIVAFVVAAAGGVSLGDLARTQPAAGI